MVLADDFKYTASGPISRIHIWGSFADDVLPARGVETLTFEVSIYSNSPSRPGTLLWTRTFAPGEYAVRMVHDGPEGWCDPLRDTYQRDNHRLAYQYNLCADKDPFIQQEGTVYWLVVKLLEPANSAHKFGWKSTCPDFRWNQDAVYLAADGSWRTLAYPGGHENAGQSLDLAFVIDSGRDSQAKYDLGDAPDSSNSLGAEMTAYPKDGPPGVTASFPTVYQAGSPPYGPLHRSSKDTAFLGYGVTVENEADIGPDVDPTNNLDPLADASDSDGSDDGVTVPLALPSCRTTTFNYVVTVVNPSTTRVYVNAWFDWNCDGDWDDTVTCPDGTVVPEWAVQNQLSALPGAGTHTMTTPPFPCWHDFTQGDLDPIWMRIALSDSPWTSSLGAGGAGPANGYGVGETEDYYFQPKNEPAPATYDWSDAPDGRTSEYSTLSEHNGARHAIAGPWLGDELGVPDAESNSQPDLTSNGIDIRVDNSDGKTRWLADDFKYTSTNRITDVRLWGSWKNDRKGHIQKIHLTIRPDDPAGAAGYDKQNRFSKPAPEVLWSKSFGLREFAETSYHIVCDTGEWWWDPAAGQLIAGGDTEVWQIDVSLSPRDAFLQQGTLATPILYWLQVQVETTDGQFGWKTRRWPDHYMDDAVWDMAADKPGAWKELRYPKEHPYYCVEKNSIDMAFSLGYTEEIIENPTTRPGSVTQCPMYSTRCPTVRTKCPSLSTQCPTVATRCPAVETRCPEEKTQCPIVSTTCPTSTTQCPVVSTSCPTVSTQCPRCVRQPASLTVVAPCPALDVVCPSFVPDLLAAVTRPATQESGSWAEFIHKAVPWNVPVLACAIHSLIAAVLFRWSTWTPQNGGLRIAD